MKYGKKRKRNKEEYQNYLRGTKWRKFRLAALEYYGNRCGLCGSKFNLEVHHKTYQNLFKESIADVMILCTHCHKGHHKQQIKRNGKRSKYMKDPSYDIAPITYYPNRNKP